MERKTFYWEQKITGIGFPSAFKDEKNFKQYILTSNISKNILLPCLLLYRIKEQEIGLFARNNTLSY